jgi:hypothetical protein
VRTKHLYGFLAALVCAALLIGLRAGDYMPPRHFDEVFSIDDFISRKSNTCYMNIIVFDRALGPHAAITAHNVRKHLTYRANRDASIASLVLMTYDDVIDRKKLELADENLKPTSDFDAIVVYIYPRG